MSVTAVLLILFVVFCLLWLVRYVWLRRRMYALANNIPGPTGLPLLGSSLSFTGNPEHTFNRFLNLFEVYGPLVKVWLGPKLFVGIADPADAQLVLGNQKIRNRDYPLTLAVIPFFGLGLFTNRDEAWRTHRKLITPAFHFKILDSYMEIFQSKANILADQLKDIADGRTVDIHHQISLCMLDAICETAIGVNMNLQNKGMSEFGQGVFDAMDLIHNRALKPWLLLEWLYPMTADGKKAKKIIKHITAFSENIITTKLAEYRRGIKASMTVTTGSNKQITSFLDSLIESSEKEGQVLNEIEIRDEVTTMAAAGMDTTTTSLAYILVLLGMHPECQERINEEMFEIFGDSDRPATAEDVQKMTYVENCIKETLRLFPIATLLAREIPEDLELTRGYVLPAGCSVVVMTYPIHRDVKNYVDPERFWPDRWTGPNSVGRHPYAYLPFSAGSRNCIGQKYAILSLKTMLSTLLRRYRVSCTNTMEELKHIQISLSIRSGIGYKIQLHIK